MPIDFGTYSYIADNQNTLNPYSPDTKINNIDATKTDKYDDKKFSKDLYQEYLSKKEYTQAADYLRKYKKHDPIAQDKHINMINYLEDQGRKLESCYQRISDPDDRDMIDFYDAVNDGNIQKYRNNLQKENRTNQYLDKYLNYKDKMFGDECEEISITYEPQSRGLFGKPNTNTFWGKVNDYLMPDNDDNNIDTFCQKLGVTKQQLQHMEGISLIENLKDGRTTIRFKKNSPYADKILLNTNVTGYDDEMLTTAFNRHGVTIQGLDKYGNGIKVGYGKGSLDYHRASSDWSAAENPIMNAVNSTTNPFDLSPIISNTPIIGDILAPTLNYISPDSNLDDMKDLIRDAKNVKDLYFSPISNDKFYSSCIGEDIDDYMNKIRTDCESGKLTRSEYDKLYKDYITSYKPKLLKAIGSAEYQFFSNYFNDEGTDQRLKYIDNKDRAILQNFLATADEKDIKLNSMISDGRIGTLVTIDPYALSEKEKVAIGQDKNFDVNGDAYHGKRIQIFIPQFGYHEAQKQLYRNTGTRTSMIVNDLQDYGGTYKGENNKFEMYYNGNGTFTYKVKKWSGEHDIVRNNSIDETEENDYYGYKYKYLDGYETGERIISFEEAQRILHKDVITRDAGLRLPLNFLNRAGEFIGGSDGIKKYEEAVLKLAYTAANELHPNIPFVDKDNNALTPKQCLEMVYRNDEEKDYKTFAKFRDFGDIYMSLLNQVNNFGIETDKDMNRRRHSGNHNLMQK